MPYLVAMPDALACTLTYNTTAGEGGSAQHVGIIRSTDGGGTWGSVIDIEPASNPESSWVMPWYDAERDLLYAFYVYNFEDVRSIPNSNGAGSTSRVDCIGKIAYRVSADRGLTWGARNLITLGAKDIDNRNPFSGAKQLLWLFGQPVVHDGKLYLGFSKMGVVVGGNQFVDTESFILRADIGATLSNFTQLPSTGTGIKMPVPFWSTGETKTSEEPSIVVHSDGVVNVVARNERGRLGESYSTDGGSTFTNDWARQPDGYYTVYHPRGPGAMFSLPDGRFFLWTYNNGEPGFNGRNPVWYRIGERVGDRIRWGAAYALCFYQTVSTRIGYPSLVVLDDEILISASDKTKAKLMRFPVTDL